MKVAEGVKMSGCIASAWERAVEAKNARRRMEESIVKDLEGKRVWYSVKELLNYRVENLDGSVWFGLLGSRRYCIC